MTKIFSILLILLLAGGSCYAQSGKPEKEVAVAKWRRVYEVTRKGILTNQLQQVWFCAGADASPETYGVDWDLYDCFPSSLPISASKDPLLSGVQLSAFPKTHLWEKEQLKMMVEVSNYGPDTVLFSNLVLILQAKDKEGNWVDLERQKMHRAEIISCKTALSPGNKWQLWRPVYTGSFKTKLRYKLVSGSWFPYGLQDFFKMGQIRREAIAMGMNRDSLECILEDKRLLPANWKYNDTVYSNEWVGRIHPEQLTAWDHHRRIINSTVILVDITDGDTPADTASASPQKGRRPRKPINKRQEKALQAR